MRKKRTNVMYFNRHIQSMPIKLSALTIFLIGIICFLVSCKKEFECKLKDTATQKVEYKYNSKGDLTDCYHVDKKRNKSRMPGGLRPSCRSM